MEGDENEGQTGVHPQPPAVFVSNLDLRKSLPEHVLGTALAQYYNVQKDKTIPDDKTEEDESEDVTPT